MEDGRSGRLRKDLPLPGKILITALDENLKSSEQSPAGAAGHGFPWAPEGGSRAARGGARAWHGLKNSSHFCFVSPHFSSLQT